MSRFSGLDRAFRVFGKEVSQSRHRRPFAAARAVRRELAALGIFVCFPLIASKLAIAQPTQNAIRGTIRNGTGKPVAGIRVTLDLSSPSGERKIKETTSAGDGSFRFDDLAPGSYTVKASCPSCDLPPDISFPLRAGQDMKVSLVVNEPAREEVAPVHPPSTSPSQAVREKSGGSLAGVGFDEKPNFKAAQYSNPEAGGGYSNSASVGSERMVREYLAPQQIGMPLGAEASNGRAIERLAQSDPTLDHLNHWGNFLLGQRRYLQAVNVFDEAAKRYPRSPTLRVGLGIALSSAGKYKEAVKELAAATDLDPSDTEPYLFLGQATILERAPDPEASKRLKHFADIDPENAQALYYYAMSLWAEEPASTGRASLNPIETLLKKSAALDPALGQARLELGILYEQEGRDDEALQEYQAAERAAPGMAAVHYRLSQAYQRSGDKTAAQKEVELYQKAQAPSPAPR